MEKKITIRPTTLYAILKPIPSLLVGALIILIVYYLSSVYFKYFPEHLKYENYFTYFIVAVALIFILRYFYRTALIMSRRYIISKEKLNFTRGVFSIQTDYIELYRVKDFIEKRPFVLRLINSMVLTMLTSDRTHEEFSMPGIPRSDIGYNLSILVERNRMKKGVREID